MANSRLSFLGVFDAEVDGRQIFFAPKVRMLLALLATRRGQWIPVEVLTEELWSGEPLPSSATKTMQGNILRIRRGLGDDAVLARRGSYALNVDHSDLVRRSATLSW